MQLLSVTPWGGSVCYTLNCTSYRQWSQIDYRLHIPMSWPFMLPASLDYPKGWKDLWRRFWIFYNYGRWKLQQLTSRNKRDGITFALQVCKALSIEQNWEELHRDVNTYIAYVSVAVLFSPLYSLHVMLVAQGSAKTEIIFVIFLLVIIEMLLYVKILRIVFKASEYYIV